MIVGFTGTRNGLTEPQRDALLDEINQLKPRFWLHGACVGADAEGVALVLDWAFKNHSVRVFALPGKSASGPEEHSLQDIRALDDSHVIRETKTYFERNRDIVNECDVLVACPGTMEELNHGGTWYTIRYARKLSKRVVIIWPDGSRLRSYTPKWG